MTQKLTIMIGNLASGKTTYIHKLLLRKPESKRLVVVSKDSFRWMLGGGGLYVFSDETEPLVHKLTLVSIRLALQAGFDVIYDETNMNQETRGPFIAEARVSGVKEAVQIEAIVLPQISVTEALDRRCGKNGSGAWDHSRQKWREVWHRKNNLFEPPTMEEGFNSIRALAFV